MLVLPCFLQVATNGEVSNGEKLHFPVIESTTSQALHTLIQSGQVQGTINGITVCNGLALTQVGDYKVR